MADKEKLAEESLTKKRPPRWAAFDGVADQMPDQRE
jgi:hypothetical protein